MTRQIIFEPDFPTSQEIPYREQLVSVVGIRDTPGTFDVQFSDGQVFREVPRQDLRFVRAW